MIYSMTGFGKSSGLVGGNKVTVEVKSLNSKQLDLVLRLPTELRQFEPLLRGILSQGIERGKVEVVVSIDGMSPDAAVLNVERLAQYKRQIEAASQALQLPEPLNWWDTLLRLPDALSLTPHQWSEAEGEMIGTLMGEALTSLTEFRAVEGRRLEQFFDQAIGQISELLEQVPRYEQGRAQKVRARLVENLEKLGPVAYDNNRLEQELIFYIEKFDITEEKVRLRSHLTYFSETLHGEPGQGKKLGFIAQEMGREINTLGSKANQAELQNLVVKMKDHLEQIKEQVLNVL